MPKCNRAVEFGQLCQRSLGVRGAKPMLRNMPISTAETFDPVVSWLGKSGTAEKPHFLASLLRLNYH